MILRAATPEDQSVLVSYIAGRLRVSAFDLVGQMPFEAAASIVRNQLMGAVLYTNYRGPSIEMTCAGEPGWLTRTHLREFFAYPFLQLGCRRVTGIVHRKNKHARKINERLGFKLEGVCRHGFENGDACVYGLTREDCKWI